VDCRECVELLDASIDGELAAAQQTDLESHLAACVDCRELADHLRAQHAELRQAFEPRRQNVLRVQESVLGRIRAEAVRTEEKPLVLPVRAAEATPNTATTRLPSWFALAMAAAVGFLLAVLVFQPWKSNAPASEPAVAQVAMVTGPIEVLSPNATAWSAAPAGTSITQGTRIRTGNNVRCELLTPDGSKVRLNSDTSVRFASARDVQLESGQVWICNLDTCFPFKVEAGKTNVTSGEGQFDLVCRPPETFLTVARGAADLSCAAGGEKVNSGESARVVDGTVTERGRIGDVVLATRWVNEILVRKGRDDAEVNQRVNDLLAQIGESKLSNLYEEEIRSLGDSCVLPLLRYLQSERSKDQEFKRLEAARILSDIAPPWSIPELIELLADDDNRVRGFAATGLTRLTGYTQGLSPEQWRSTPWAGCKSTYQQWQAWWLENKHRFPGALDTDIFARSGPTEKKT
jgi:hypothetical protein